MNTIKFCTGSTFRGSSVNVNQKMIMDGFGTYTYPNGSTYRGDFRDGRFHGLGQMKLAPPYNMTISGIFSDGKLVTMHAMKFNDGLRFYRMAIEEGEEDMNGFENWNYCQADDRRYFREHYEGYNTPIENANITAQGFDRELRAGRFDTGEGFYWPVSSFLQSSDSRLARDRFIGCDKEADWIKKNCRYGGSQKENPDFDARITFPSIIKNNIKAMKEADAVSNGDGESKHQSQTLMKWEKLLTASLDKRIKCPNAEHSENSSFIDRSDCYLTDSKSSCELGSLASSLLRHTILFPCPEKRSSTRSLNKRTSDVISFGTDDFNLVHFSFGDINETLSAKSEAHLTDQDAQDKESVSEMDELRKTRVRFHNVRTISKEGKKV